MLTSDELSFIAERQGQQPNDKTNTKLYTKLFPALCSQTVLCLSKAAISIWNWIENRCIATRLRVYRDILILSPPRGNRFFFRHENLWEISCAFARRACSSFSSNFAPAVFRFFSFLFRFLSLPPSLAYFPDVAHVFSGRVSEGNLSLAENEVGSPAQSSHASLLTIRDREGRWCGLATRGMPQGGWRRSVVMKLNYNLFLKDLYVYAYVCIFSACYSFLTV